MKNLLSIKARVSKDGDIKIDSKELEVVKELESSICVEDNNSFYTVYKKGGNVSTFSDVLNEPKENILSIGDEVVVQLYTDNQLYFGVNKVKDYIRSYFDAKINHYQSLKDKV